MSGRPPTTAALAEILRASRARVHPADVGLPDDGRDYLLTVGGPAPRRRRAAPQAVAAPTLRLLDALTESPAMVLGRFSAVLAWNPLAAALICDFAAIPAEQRVMARLAFLHPDFRRLYGDWERVAQDCVASLRMQAARDPDDAQLAAIVGELSIKDADFRRWWGDHRVRGSESRRKRYVHPVAGPMTLDVQRFAVLAQPDQLLVVYSAEPGSQSEAALRFLTGWSGAASG